MRLYTFELQGRQAIGAEWKGQLIDLAVACEAMTRTLGARPDVLSSLPNSMSSLLQLGPTGLSTIKHILTFISKRPPLPVGVQVTYALDSVKLLAPIPRPGKILCMALRGIDEHEEQLPDITIKVATSVIGPGQAIICQAESIELQFEAHLAAVIGETLRDANERTVMRGIAGFTILNNVSLDKGAKDALPTELAANCDTYCPMGPCIVSAEDFWSEPDPKAQIVMNDLALKKGAIGLPKAVLARKLSWLSGGMTLEPGDVVSVKLLDLLVVSEIGGSFRIDIQGIGTLENPFGSRVSNKRGK